MNFKQLLLILLAGILIGALFLYLHDQPMSYLSFNNRDSDYYKKIADSCDELLRTAPATVLDGRELHANDIHLPLSLKALRPDFLSLTTNRVYISVGVGRGAYGIAWQKSHDLNSDWELRTYAEDLEKLLFTRIRYNNFNFNQGLPHQQINPYTQPQLGLNSTRQRQLAANPAPVKIAQPFMAGKIANPFSKSRQGRQNISFVPGGTCDAAKP
jgi:hypothetical protein